MNVTKATSINTKEYRAALGSFATGVTVITAIASNGTPVGLTANSFNSVSLNPPMVLWSLAKSAGSFPVFMETDCWAVHILAADQESISNGFATRNSDKFAGLELENGIDGVPLLMGCAARFQCRTSFRYEGGDHVIFVGEVLEFDSSEVAPLVFHAGQYAFAAKKNSISIPSRKPQISGGLSEDLLGYLLGRAHFQFHAGFRELLKKQGLSDTDWTVVAALTALGEGSEENIDSAVSYRIGYKSGPILKNLESKGWVHRVVQIEGEGTYFQLTSAGRDRSLHLIAGAKAREIDLLERMDYSEGQMLKCLLMKFISVSDPGLSDLWSDNSLN